MQDNHGRKVKIIAFKKLDPPSRSEPIKRIPFEDVIINLVIVQLPNQNSDYQKKMLEKVQDWALTNLDKVKLWKITKQQAFAGTYRQMLKSSANTYFVTNLSIQNLKEQPLQYLYKALKDNQTNYQKLQNQAQINFQKLRFVILKEKVQGIDRRNYFHGNVHLITSSADLAISAIEDQINSVGKLNSYQSTSSVNSQEARQFGLSLKQSKTGLNYIPKQQSLQKSKEKDYECLQNEGTPGVGTYNISGFNMTKPLRK